MLLLIYLIYSIVIHYTTALDFNKMASYIIVLALTILTSLSEKVIYMYSNQDLSLGQALDTL